VLDIDVAPRAWRWITATATPQAAEAACQAEVAPFNGVEMASAVLGVPASTVSKLQGMGVSIPVADAIMWRGSVLVNRYGRVAVVVAPGRVVQPAGRRYALTTTSAAWWSSAVWFAGVINTRGQHVTSYRMTNGADLSVLAVLTGAGAVKAAGGGVRSIVATLSGAGSVASSGTAKGGNRTVVFTATGAGVVQNTAGGVRSIIAALTGDGQVGKRAGGTLAVTANRTAAGAISAGTTYISEFFNGADSASWPSPWVTARSTAGAAADVVSGRGRLRSGTLTGNAGNRYQRNPDSVNNTEFTGLFNFADFSGNNPWLDISSRTDANAAGINGYTIRIRPDGSIEFAKVVNYVLTNPVANSSIPVFNWGVDYRFRFRVVGTTIQFRAWAASGSEPGTWQINATDSSLTSGYTSIGVTGGTAGNATIWVDELVLTNGA